MTTATAAESLTPGNTAAGESQETRSIELEWFAVSTKKVEMDEPFLRQFRGTSLSRHTLQKSLFLVFNSGLACFGCEINEYLSFADNQKNPALFTVYVSKLDSTGLLEPRRFQRPAIREFLHLLFKRYQAFADSLGIPLRLHVYARSSPEYLFPESHRLPSKHILSGRKLVYWWKQSLENMTTDVKQSDIDLYWTIPGLELNELPMEHRTLSARNWKYSYPSTKSAALDVVPMFHDDTKSSYLSRTIVEDKSITVDKFINDMLSRTADFQNSQAALFVIEYTPAVNEADKISDNEHELTHNYASTELYAELEKLLNLGETCPTEVCRFSSASEAGKSSLRLLNLLKSHPECQIQKLSISQKAADLCEKRKLQEIKPITAVNVLTVKKRKVQQ